MTYRLYYNREEDFPQIWSVDEGEVWSEVNVREVQIHGCEVQTRNDLWKKKQSDFDPKKTPTTYLSIRARRPVLKGGVLHFYPSRTR